MRWLDRLRSDIRAFRENVDYHDYRCFNAMLSEDIRRKRHYERMSRELPRVISRLERLLDRLREIAASDPGTQKGN